MQVIENLLAEYPGSLLVISHDRYFIDNIVNKIWYIKDITINSLLGNFEQNQEKLN